MSRRGSRSSWLMLATALSASPGLAGDTTNVGSSDRYPLPAVRESRYRHRIATELGGGWQTFVGDLHSHPRGHSEMGGVSLNYTPQIRRDEVLLSAFRHGYDFFGTSNHTSSWDSSYDEDDPVGQVSLEQDANGQPEMLQLAGVESHLGSNPEHHFNTFNRRIQFNSNSLSNWHNEILNHYSTDPLLSTHVQLNHPNEDVFFALPTEPIRRRDVRDAVELAEYNDGYFELLRRGFRVAPAANTDSHATTREQLGFPFTLKYSTGAWVWPHIDEPGVPREKIHGRDTAQGRTGIVLPPGEWFDYGNFLRALRNRWVYRTALPPASGFFMVNGRTMGSEFSLAPAERRLDFTVWGTTKDGTGGGNNWTKLRVWSPFQPGTPIKELTYTDPNLIDLKQVFSLTPYESIYVVTLNQQWENAEVTLAPIWVQNPVAKPTITLESSSTPRHAVPVIFVNGGGDSVVLQRANTGTGFNGWQTVGTVSNFFIPLDPGVLPTTSQWRVVDPYQPEVVSNAVTLTVSNGLDVRQPNLPTPPLDGVNVSLAWTHPTPLSVDYYASRDNGATWTKVGESPVPNRYAYWSFYTGGWGGSNVTLKVVDRADPGHFGVTLPFFVSPELQLKIPATSGNATSNSIAAHTVTDSDLGSCWWTSDGNEQSVYIDLGREHLVKRMEVLFGSENPPSWYMGTSHNGSTWSMHDSGSLSYAPHQTLVKDYTNRSGGGLTARYIRFYVAGNFPGLTSGSQVCDIRLYR
ncbi:discoidin domain-containing protein [Myxococcus fulvus]|uniref:discoidin domain-containing protein n=1 Tax=Myxococcus fulvus TaxID=33 RepID=UPI003B9C965E